MTEKKQNHDEMLKFREEIFKKKLESLSMTEFKEFFNDDITAKKQQQNALKSLEEIRRSYFDKTMTPLKNETIYSEILNRKQELMKSIIKNSIKNKKFLDLIPLEIYTICESVADYFSMTMMGIEYDKIEYCSVGINNLVNWSAKSSTDYLIPLIKEKWTIDQMDDRLAGIIRAYDKNKKDDNSFDNDDEDE